VFGLMAAFEKTRV